MSSVPNESVVDLAGIVVKPQKAIESCTQQVELQITKFFVVNRATNRLPLQIADASRKVDHNQFDPNEEDEEPVKVEAKVETKAEPKVETKVEEKVEEVKTETAVEGEAKVEEGEKRKEKKEKKPKEQKKKREQKPKEEEKEKEAPIVKMKTRLDNRVIDLRTTAKQAIFKLSSGVCHVFREFCINNDFV